MGAECGAVKGTIENIAVEDATVEYEDGMKPDQGLLPVPPLYAFRTGPAKPALNEAFTASVPGIAVI